MGLHAQSMDLVKCLIEKGAVLNLINKSYVNLPWVSCIKRRQILKLRGVNKQQTVPEGVNLLHLQNGDLRICMSFGVVGDLLLGTSCTV